MWIELQLPRVNYTTFAENPQPVIYSLPKAVKGNLSFLRCLLNSFHQIILSLFQFQEDTKMIA